MNLLAIILGYALACAIVIAVIIFAVLGSPYWAIGSGCTAVWFAFIAATRAADAKQDREWADAYKHPRL